MKHHLRGYLAGLSVLLHQLEKPEVLACLHKCKESLEVPAMELLEPGMELLTNSGWFCLFKYYNYRKVTLPNNLNVVSKN